MAEKDHKKVEEQVSDPVVSTHQTYDMSRILAVLTEVFTTFQKKLEAERSTINDSRLLDGDAKVAAERFSDILAGLQLKTVPAIPKLEPKTISTTEVELVWTTSTNNAEEFELRRCQDRNCQDFTVITPGRLSSSTTNYHDIGLASNTYYRYQLVGYNSRGKTVSNIVDIVTEIKTTPIT